MDDVSSDTDMSTTSSLSFASSSAQPASLTPHQNNLMTTYNIHSKHIINLMNAIVELDISVRRERDEPSLAYLAKDLEKAQEDLVRHRDGKRKNDADIKREEERLNAVVGEESVKAKTQLDEMAHYMGTKERMIVCLR